MDLDLSEVEVIAGSEEVVATVEVVEVAALTRLTCQVVVVVVAVQTDSAVIQELALGADQLVAVMAATPDMVVVTAVELLVEDTVALRVEVTEMVRAMEEVQVVVVLMEPAVLAEAGANMDQTQVDSREVVEAVPQAIAAVAANKAVAAPADHAAVAVDVAAVPVAADVVVAREFPVMAESVMELEESEIVEDLETVLVEVPMELEMDIREVAL